MDWHGWYERAVLLRRGEVVSSGEQGADDGRADVETMVSVRRVVRPLEQLLLKLETQSGDRTSRDSEGHLQVVWSLEIFSRNIVQTHWEHETTAVITLAWAWSLQFLGTHSL